MDGKEYQELAMRTSAPDSSLEKALIVGALGLSGETGELLAAVFSMSVLSSSVADSVKKTVSQGHPLDSELLVKEMGDVLWYIAKICTVLDISMGSVMGQNIAKLKERYPNGFTTEESRNRTV